jgi:hypothetical protein
LHVLELRARVDLDVREVAADGTLDLSACSRALARLRLDVDERVLLDTAEVLLFARGRHDTEGHRVRARELLARVNAGDRHLHRARERVDELEPSPGPTP